MRSEKWERFGKLMRTKSLNSLIILLGHCDDNDDGDDDSGDDDDKDDSKG